MNLEINKITEGYPYRSASASVALSGLPILRVTD
ncbi:hypothetical protein SAMN05216365_11282 [Porphyromonadaceae bacterium NLAE-zl-C104]|nr:hypothetical protein SAMN05216365_11282 [Porphyromonadaceae bacterium NLAE-zl-C104]